MAKTAVGTGQIRLIAATETAIGLVLLITPTVAARLSPAGTPEAPRWLVRLLGARMAAQGTAALTWPTPTVARAGAVIDVLHSASMVSVVAASRRYRRPALASALVAAAFGAALSRAASSERRRCAAISPRPGSSLDSAPGRE